MITPSTYLRQQSFLEKAIETSRVSHAYLFSGPKGVGKKEMALWFAYKLNPAFQINPEQRYTNLILIEPQEKDRQQAIIEVKQILGIKNKISLHSSKNSYRVVIIDQAQRMTKVAQNSLLKILEEPYKKTVFILIVNRSQTLLETIYSRCQNVKFNLITAEKIRQRLEKENLPLKQIQKIAWLSHGRWAKAQEYLKFPDKIEEECTIFKKINTFFQSSLNERFGYEKEFCSERIKLIHFMEGCLFYLQDLILAKGNIAVDSSQLFNQSKPNYSWEELNNFATFGQQILTLLNSTNINVRLAFGQIVINF